MLFQKEKIFIHRFLKFFFYSNDQRSPSFEHLYRRNILISKQIFFIGESSHFFCCFFFFDFVLFCSLGNEKFRFKWFYHFQMNVCCSCSLMNTVFFSVCFFISWMVWGENVIAKKKEGKGRKNREKIAGKKNHKETKIIIVRSSWATLICILFFLFFRIYFLIIPSLCNRSLFVLGFTFISKFHLAFVHFSLATSSGIKNQVQTKTRA